MENNMYRKFETFMQERGLSPYKISKEAHVSQPTLSDWKRGKSEPKRATLEKICVAYNLPLSYFYEDSGVIGEKDPSTITISDRKEIGRDLDRIMNEIENDIDGPLYYNGEPIDDESLELLRKALELGLTKLKQENKVKYNPNKNKKK